MPDSPSLLTSLADLVRPRCCVHCAAPADGLCADCRQSLTPLQVTLAEGGDVVHAAGAYDDVLRTAIVAYKERGRRDLVRPLAQLLAEAADRALAQADAVRGRSVALVAVTSARAAARARGGQHVSRLVSAVAAEIGRPVALGALSRRRTIRDSAGLGADERHGNVAGAFAARPPPPVTGLSALVLDDIVTTGATMAECVRALRAAGWPIVGAAVIAATPRRFPRSR